MPLYYMSAIFSIFCYSQTRFFSPVLILTCVKHTGINSFRTLYPVCSLFSCSPTYSLHVYSYCFLSLLTPLCLYCHRIFFPRLYLSTGTSHPINFNLVSYIRFLKYLKFLLISAAYLHLLSCSFCHRSDPADVRRNATVRNLNKSSFPELNKHIELDRSINPLNPELNPICYLLALLGAHHFLRVGRIRVKLLTFRRLMSYIYGAPILDVSKSRTTTQHSR